MILIDFNVVCLSFPLQRSLRRKHPSDLQANSNRLQLEVASVVIASELAKDLLQLVAMNLRLFVDCKLNMTHLVLTHRAQFLDVQFLDVRTYTHTCICVCNAILSNSHARKQPL